ncbi:unnamed protein product, partial [Rotaria magnacalcarata]
MIPFLTQINNISLPADKISHHQNFNIGHIMLSVVLNFVLLNLDEIIFKYP